MQNRQKSPPYSLGLVLLIAGITTILFYHSNSPLTGQAEIFGAILIIVQLVLLYAILRESNFIYSGYFRLVNIAVALYIAGSYFKMQHYAYGDTILLLALSGVILIYSFRLLAKRNMRALDIAKWLWVTSACTSFACNIFHWSYGILTGWTEAGSFLLMLVLYFIQPPFRHQQEDIPIDVPIDQVE